MARNISDVSDSYLNCLSSIENNISVLYNTLADRVTLSSVKLILYGVAAGCQRNSTILKGFGKDVEEPAVKSKERDEELADVFDAAYDFYKKVTEKEAIAAAELRALAGQLVALEGMLGEKYLFVHSKISKLVLHESVRLLHGLDLDKLGLMFDRLMCTGEERHKLLVSVKTLAEEKASEEKKSASDGFIVLSPVLDQVATPYCGK